MPKHHLSVFERQISRKCTKKLVKCRKDLERNIVRFYDGLMAINNQFDLWGLVCWLAVLINIDGFSWPNSNKEAELIIDWPDWITSNNNEGSPLTLKSIIRMRNPDEHEVMLKLEIKLGTDLEIIKECIQMYWLFRLGYWHNSINLYSENM